MWQGRWLLRCKDKAERVIYFGGTQNASFQIFERFKKLLLEIQRAILNSIQKNMVWIYERLFENICRATTFKQKKILLLLFQYPLKARNMVSIAHGRSSPSKCTIYMKQGEKIFVRGRMWSVLVLIPHFLCEFDTHLCNYSQLT